VETAAGPAPPRLIFLVFGQCRDDVPAVVYRREAIFPARTDGPLDRGYTDEDPPKFHDTDQPAYQSIVAVGYNGATNAPHLPERMVPKRASNKTSIEIKNIKVSNSAYYKALSARDLRAMERVWTCAADNMLIAPRPDPHVYVGWAAIRQNWEAYWPTFERYRVSMRVNEVQISGPVAWVHGIETSHRRTKSGEVSSGQNYGTNIFVERNGRWFMVFHQAVAIPKERAGKATRFRKKPKSR
jgi:ketosteroid isomerase-like protein